jgi:hypothetical protein
MKAKVTLFKVRVKEASKALSINEISTWEKIDCYVPEYSDITRLPDDAGMETISFSAIRIINISVN